MSGALPENFRKLPVEERLRVLARLYGVSERDLEGVRAGDLGLADVMVESAIGYLPVPLGLAAGFLIDGIERNIPMAVEEPSVIAAAAFAARLVAADGGFTTDATEPVMSAQLFLDGVSDEAFAGLAAQRAEIAALVDASMPSMCARGGGFRDLELSRLPQSRVVRVQLYIDVRDTMGANLLNTTAELVRPRLEQWSGGTGVMSILSNEAERRRASAAFSLPVRRLARGGLSGEVAAARIVLASEIAQEDASRAVTHNKGVMNGISALALATGNDTRAIEAAVHRYAARDGRYRGITTYELRGERLVGRLEAPLAFATVGGSVGLHPATALSLRLLGEPDARTLARIAAAVGLAQNFAALFALVTEGIQKGHMRHHSARLALKAGARGAEIRELARRIADRKDYTIECARRLLSELRSELRSELGGEPHGSGA